MSYTNQPRAIQILFRQILYVGLSVVCIISLIPAKAYAADSNVLYIHRMSPSAAEQLYVNDLLTIKIGSYTSVDRSSDSASGSIVFSSDILQIINTDTGSSEFQNPRITINQGSIAFSGTRNPSQSGIAQIFQATFRVLRAGNITLNFGQGSTLSNTSTAYYGLTTTAASVTQSQPTNSSPSPSPSTNQSPSTSSPVTSPSTAPATSPSKSPSAPTSTKPSTTQQKSPQTQPKTSPYQAPSNISSIPLADTAPLSEYVAPTVDSSGLIESVTTDSQYSSSTISWKVNASNPTTRIDYGSSSARLDKSTPVNAKGDGVFSATVANLNPGVRYYFTITASGSGKTDSTYSGVLITRGYPVTLSVTENNTPVESAQIKIGNQTYTIGSNGQKTVGLAAGRYSVTITTKSASEVKDIVVEAKTIPKDGSAPENQKISFALTSSVLDGGPGSSQSILLFIGVMVGGAIALGIGVAVLIAYRRRKFESNTSSYSGGGSGVVIDDGYNWKNQK